MKALVKLRNGKGEMEVREIDRPVPAANEVLVKVVATGVCGSDLHIWKGELDFDFSNPVVLGHEYAGEIVEVGENVQHFAVGDRVVSETGYNLCGMCEPCMTGARQFCRTRKIIGIQVDGSFAEYVRIPVNVLHRLPDNIDMVSASLMEPLAVAVHAIMERAQVAVTDAVIVFGPGPVGILAAQVVRAAGAKKVIVLGTNKDTDVRLRLSRELGFPSYNLQEYSIEEVLARENQGDLIDMVIEASGAEQAIDTAINITKKDGTLIALGLPGAERIQVPWSKAVMKAILIVTSYSARYTSWEKSISLISQGKVKTAPLAIPQAELKDWEKVFADLDEGKGVKGVFIFK